MKKPITIVLLVAISLAPLTAIAQTECSAKLLIEAETGEVIEEQNSTTPLPPASTVKILVAYLVYEKVKEGLVSFDDVITVSAASSNIGGSQVYLRENETFTLRELLHAVLVQSANDAAYAIAEHIGGNAEGFSEMMNETAAALGMKDSVFHSVHGLPPSTGQLPDMVSARDFGLLSQAVLKNFPEMLEITKISELGFRNDTFIMRNHNPLVRTFPGCDGLKTGFYAKAGFSVVTTAMRNGTRLIAIVMGCPQRKQRDAEAARLLKKGFAEYKSVEVIKANTPVDAAVPVKIGVKRTVTPVTAQAFTATVRKSAVNDVTSKVEPCAELVAPIAAQTVCGQMTFYLGDRTLGSVPLVIAEAVEEKKGFNRFVDDMIDLGKKYF